MSEENTNTDSRMGNPIAEEEGTTFLDFLIVLAKHKKLVLGLPLAAALVAVIVTLLMPNIYTGRAVIMPPQQQSSAATALLGQLGILAGGTATGLGLKNPGDLYVGMLKSRTVADNIISRFKLAELFGTETMVQTRRELAAHSTFLAGKDGLVQVEYEDESPQRAADIANAYIEELDRLTQSIAITEAGQRRLFFGRQLSAAKKELADAEVALQKTQETTGIIKLDDQGRAIIEGIAFLRAQISAKEVQLTAMRSFATDKNPDYIRTQQELAGLKTELLKMEKTNSGGQGDIFMSTGKVPEAGMEYVRKFRDVKYFEAMFELLAKQFELARIDEAKDAAVIQVVDKAVPPDRKSKPMRFLIVLVTVLVFGILASLWVLAVEWVAQADLGSRSKLQHLRNLLRLQAWRS